MKTRRSIEALELVGAAYGVDTSNVVALMATVIRGVGGRGNELNLGTHICPEPGMQIGVVGDPGYVSSILDHLLAPVRKIQQNLTEQFGRIDPVILEQAWRGSQEGDLVGSVADDGERVDRRFHLRALLGESSEQNGLMGELNGNTDFEPDLIYRRLEFILRPRFLVENARIGQLQKELGGCHVGRGLVVGGEALHLKHLDQKGIAVLQELIGGTRLPVPEMLSRARKGITLPSDGTFVISGDLEDWGNPKVQSLRSSLLLIGHELREVPKSLDGQLLSQALDGWKRLILGQLSLRKVGMDSTGPALSEEDGIEFTARHLGYLKDCTELGMRDGVVRDLPLTLLGLLCIICCKDTQEEIFDSVFDYAENLRDRHVMIERRLRGQAEVARVIELAVKLRQRVAEKETAKLRDLVRSFDVQKTGIYLPVLEMMVKGGLLVEPKSKTYGLGKQDDVAGIMARLVESNHLRLVA